MCITCNIVQSCGQGASEASGTLAITGLSADYQSADYVQRASTRHGGILPPARYIIPLRNLCQNSYSCPLSDINWNNPLSVKTCLNISSNTFGGIVQICAPAANALPTVAASLMLAANIFVSDLL